ncbi:MAG: hypothetical protein AB1782_19885 [Cyanobacteriota bacterium]
MTELGIQDLLHEYVESGGKNVTVDQVKPYLNDPNIVNRRVAYELMNAMTGDANYLIRCVPAIKDDLEQLWDFLLNYTSESKDVYLITLLITEAMKYIHPVTHYDMVEKLLHNWRILNPCMYELPENEEIASKVKDLHMQCLPVIANVFVNRLLVGAKGIPYFEFNYFPYYLINLPGLKISLPKYATETIKSLPDGYQSNYEMGILSVFEHDIDSANTYFLKAVKELIKKNNLLQSYNLLVTWYDSVARILDKKPDLVVEILDVLWNLSHEAFIMQPDNSELFIMSCFMYSELASKLVGTRYFNYVKILELSEIYESKFLSYKNKLKLSYNYDLSPKNKINIGILSLSINKGASGSLSIDFIKHNKSDKFNIIFYDCAMAPEISRLNIKELSEYCVVSQVDTKGKDRLTTIVEIANKINNDKIDILLYNDWLYNVIGQAVCVMKPAPIIIALGVSGISTGLSCVSDIIDYLGIVFDSELKFTEKPAIVSLSYPEILTDKLDKTKCDIGLSQESIMLYSHSHLEKVSEGFLEIVAMVLERTDNTIFAFSGGGESSTVMKFFKTKNLQNRVKYLEILQERELRLSIINLCDIYLNSFPFPTPEDVYYSMILEKPVVTIKPDGRDLFSNKVGHALLKFDECIASDKNDFAEKVIGLINSEENRKKLGRKLSASAKKELKFDSYMLQLQNTLLNMYRETFVKT